MHKILIACLLSLLAFGASAQAAFLPVPSGHERKVLMDSVQRRLAKARTPVDSLRIMCDIFDLAPAPEKFSRGMEAYRMATRLRSNSARLGLLREVANVTDSNDSLLNIVLREVLRK